MKSLLDVILAVIFVACLTVASWYSSIPHELLEQLFSTHIEQEQESKQ